MASDRDLGRPQSGSDSYKARLVAGTALVLLFASGIAVGFAWDQTANANTVEETGTVDQPQADGRRRMIVDNVGLNAAQRLAIDSLVILHRQRMSDLEAEFKPRHRAVIEDLREEIKEVLTLEQREQYDVLLIEHDAKRAERAKDGSKK